MAVLQLAGVERHRVSVLGHPPLTLRILAMLLGELLAEGEVLDPRLRATFLSRVGGMDLELDEALEQGILGSDDRVLLAHRAVVALGVGFGLFPRELFAGRAPARVALDGGQVIGLCDLGRHAHTK